MSGTSEGSGWWIASDGKWYPPELHPSVRARTAPEPAAEQVSPDQVPTQAGAEVATASDSDAPQGRRWQPQADTRVGPQFPDLFKKALEGSHLADNVSVKYDGDDDRKETDSFGSVRVGASTDGGAGAGKRKWRKGR